jgi:cytochrome c oxidase subunit 1
MAMALIGGFFAYTFRMQIAFPGVDVPGFGVVSPNEYNHLITNHGAIMIFWVAMPVLIAAFGNYLIPLMIGCDDMVFPKINRLSYQIFLLSALILMLVLLPGGGFAARGRCTRRSRPAEYGSRRSGDAFMSRSRWSSWRS